MIFTKLRFKNFFSSGNAFIEIDLTKYKKSVIAGANGNGKSTIANALVFVLFNKTIKKGITKAQIINSINNKNCLVEIEFIDNNNTYLVRRGIKPNIFEIFENGVLIDQTLIADYQTHLEEKILKCSYRTFIQTSIISLENYKPFMEMTKADRREFIEDILDIRVFSTMNILLKSQVTKQKEELRLLDMSIKSLKEKIVMQKSHIEQLEEIKKTGIDAIDGKIEEYSAEIATISNTYKEYEALSLELSDKRNALTKLIGSRNVINSSISATRAEIAHNEKHIKFFQQHDECPTCKQNMAESHINAVTTDHDAAMVRLNGVLLGLQEQLDGLGNIDQENTNLTRLEASNSANMSSANTSISRLTRQIRDAYEEKDKILSTSDLSDQKAELSESAKKAYALSQRRTELNDQQNYNVVMLELFKDSGIKSKIVDQYIPVINSLVNKYLEALDFYVSFNLDSEFSETIKSRHRDTFTYNSFSMGERQRIDLSLLFTFRQISRMKNAFGSNIFIADESLDASIDAAGIELLVDIFDSETFAGSNILVISHRNKEVFQETFDGVYEVYKRDGFTQLSEA